MEEHLEAYFAWKAQKIKDAWCWHVDAHLDVGKTGLPESRLQRVADCRSSAEVGASGDLGNSYLPWGGLHCGNYLYPAIREGIVTRLSWVFPPELVDGTLLNWAQRHLNEWFDLSLSEYSSLRVEGDKVLGTLLGIPFEMGTLEALGVPDQPVLLDIDLDYFLTEQGEVWQQPGVFVEKTQNLQSLCTTLAYSVKGGFTPAALREIAEPLLERWAEANLQRPPIHQWSREDEMAAQVRCHRYSEALAEAAGSSVECRYLRGSSLQYSERKEEALEEWLSLLKEPAMPADGLSYLHGLASEIYLEQGKPKEALEHSLAAQRAAPDDYRHGWTEAVAREALGEVRKATKVLRQLVRDTEHLLFGLKVRYALARLYQAQGKDGLARLEMQKLAQLDVTGQFRAQTMLYV